MKAIVLVLALLVLLLAACQTYPFAPANPLPPPTCEELAQQEESPNNLSFETIAREATATNEQDWPERRPGLFVAAVSQDIREIEQYIRETAATALQEVDFEKSVVVAAFSGSKGHGSWGFCITSVTQHDGEVLLHAHLVESPVAPDIMASYYHLLRLPKKELPTGEVTFHLALTRHEWIYPSAYGKTLEKSEEETVTSITRSLP